jgi:hypothetical protein
MNEDPFLEREFGEDYLRFKQEVPRWRVRLTPAPARGRAQVFEWSLFMRNHELPRALAHLIVLGVFGFYFFFGNPVVGVDPLVRATVVGAVAIWFLLHDIYPLDVSRVHAGWLLPGAGAVGGAIFLAIAPVWTPWSGAPGWTAVVLGLALGLLAAATAWWGRVRSSGRTANAVFAQPLCQWYVVGFGLGLLSLTLGGLWLGVLAPFVLWSLSLAGIVAARPLPSSSAAVSSLLVVFGAAGAYAVARLLG